jgi:alkanesulfonate monooxygenase SsuD/methylene tetrahydromethanopterin reductase-like flavin-dependent oxidoreductase (luciferase family)
MNGRGGPTNARNEGGSVSDNHGMRIGIVSGMRRPFPELVERWREAEALGFDTVWVTDHFITGNEPDKDAGLIYEAWTVIAALAMVTERIRFGVMVTGNTYRNPALLFKQAVTVDHVSNGRLELGLGAGWWEREHEAYGYPFPKPGELVERLREALEIWDSLRTQERTDYHGSYYWVTDAPFEPKPINGYIPLLIGSFGPKMLALTAKHADIWNTRGKPDVAAERATLLDELCREIGRDPRTIRRSVWPHENPWDSVDSVTQMIESYRVHGFSDFVFSWPDDGQVEVMREFMREKRDQGLGT